MTATNQNKQDTTKTFMVGCGIGVIMSSAFYIGYKVWKSSYHQIYKKISALKYSSDEKINKMLHACAAIIEMNTNGYLSTINSIQSNKQYPCCRMIDTRWKPPVSLPYIYVGSNRESRKIKQIEMNNNVVVTFGDIEGIGFVSIYGQLIEMKDKKKAKSMFPTLWRLFLNGPNDKRFVMFTLYIERIEFVSHRFDYDGTRNDWKPFILKRVKSTLLLENAEWELVDSPDIKLS